MAKKPNPLAKAVTVTRQLLFLAGVFALAVGGVVAAWERLAGVRAMVVACVAFTIGLGASAFAWLRRSYARAVLDREAQHASERAELEARHAAARGELDA